MSSLYRPDSPPQWSHRAEQTRGASEGGAEFAFAGCCCITRKCDHGGPPRLAVGETVILLTLSLSPSLLRHLLKGAGGVAE